MKHNKKRNTAFLYECLIRELTKAILKEDKQGQTKVKGLLREFFAKGKVLAKELDLYKSLLESKELNQDFSRRLMVETKKDFDTLPYRLTCLISDGKPCILTQIFINPNI